LSSIVPLADCKDGDWETSKVGCRGLGDKDTVGDRVVENCAMGVSGDEIDDILAKNETSFYAH
jgi:hypothetical protein